MVRWGLGMRLAASLAVLVGAGASCGDFWNKPEICEWSPPADDTVVQFERVLEHDSVVISDAALSSDRLYLSGTKRNGDGAFEAQILVIDRATGAVTTQGFAPSDDVGYFDAIMPVASGSLIGVGRHRGVTITSFTLDGTILWTTTFGDSFPVSAYLDPLGILVSVGSTLTSGTGRTLHLVSLDGREIWATRTKGQTVRWPRADSIAVVGHTSVEWLTAGGELVRECAFDPHPFESTSILVAAGFPGGSVAAVLRDSTPGVPSAGLLVRMNDHCEILWRRLFDHGRFGETRLATVTPDGEELILLGYTCSDGLASGPRVWITRHGESGAVVAEHRLGPPATAKPFQIGWATPACLLLGFRIGLTEESTGLVGFGEPGAECGFGP
jgi:hypothetical protein